MTRNLPPDPFEGEDVDLWALEQAETLAREAEPDDVRWDDLDGPTLDDFDAANEDDISGEQGRGWDSLDALTKISIIGAGLALIAVLLALLSGN